MAKAFQKPEPEDKEDLIVFVELDPQLTPEEQNVVAWREDALLRVGVGAHTAYILASTLNADLHQALAIKAKGCTDALLLEIMT